LTKRGLLDLMSYSATFPPRVPAHILTPESSKHSDVTPPGKEDDDECIV
jgi:hypothetical protein